MLLVIGGILVAYGLSNVMKGVGNLSQPLDACSRQVKQIAIALESYKKDHGGKYPAKLEDLTSKYLANDPKVLHCPADKKPAGDSYEYMVPPANATDSFIVVRCGRHEFMGIAMGPIIQKDGKVYIDERIDPEKQRKGFGVNVKD